MSALSTVFDRTRAFVGLPAPAKADEPAKGEAGSDVDLQGWWYSEYLGGGPDVNPELSFSQKFEVYDEMRKTDAVVKGTLLFRKLPVRAASWGLNPKDESNPLDVGIRDFVNWNLGIEEEDGQLDLSWDETVQQFQQAHDFGVMFEEMVWGEVREWVDADGDSHLVRPLARLAPRYPRSIKRVVRDGSKITSLEQWAQGAKPIPGEKLLHIIPEREGARWDGVSMLRPMWGAWRLKKALMIAAGIGWDRFASGLPVIYHPDDPGSAEIAKEIGRDIRQHERGYVRLPVPQGHDRGQSAWGVDLLNGSQTLADPTPLLRWYSAQISEAGLAHFAQLGNTDTGSRATAQVQIDPFFLAVQADAGYLRRERSRLIRKIVEVNFGAEAAEHHAPVLTISKIQAQNVAVLSRAIADLSSAGLTFTDRDAQDDIRELLGLPGLPAADLAAAGIDKAKLESLLAGAGLSPEALAGIVAQLPDSLGVAKNTAPVPSEGTGLTAIAGGKQFAFSEPGDRPSVVIVEAPPATIVGPDLVAAVVKLAEREIPAPIIKVERAAENVLPSQTFNIHVPGQAKPRRATAKKKKDGSIEVRYSADD